MNLTKKRWIILIASCFINLCIGSIYAWSVFASPMAEYLSALTGTTFTAGTLAIVFTVTNSVGPITMITGGRINDKFGPKKVIFVGGLIFGIGMILAGYSKSLPMLILTYGVILGLGVGMVYGCTISNSIKFFPDKRGLVGGVTTAAYGLSSVIIPPIANSIINAFDVTMAFKSIGVAFLIIVCVSSFFIEKCPSNFVPEGWTPPANLDNKLNKNDKDWREMLSSPIFYVMITLLTCGAFYGLMCTSMAFIISIVGLFCLAISSQGDIVKFYIGISIVGVCFGAFMGVFPGFTVDQFGAKNNSVNYGIMFIGFAFAGYIAPTVMKNVYASYGDYKRAFIIGIVMALVGLGLTFVYRFVNNKDLVKKELKKIS